jgi:predicted RNase H-like HicB family nuclease
MDRLAVVIEKDEEGLYVVCCPALKGCWSQGKTEEEAMANIREAIAGWLAAEENRARSALRPGQELREVALG